MPYESSLTMKLFATFLFLHLAAVAQSVPPSSLVGIWTGTATVHGQQVPLTLDLSNSSHTFSASLLNGPEHSAASSATLTGTHLLVSFDYFARTLDATLTHGTLTGTFGTTTVRYPVVLSRATPPAPTLIPPAITGDWEIAVQSAKGESAWQLHLEPAAPNPALMRAVIQRIDGDTGSLYGSFNGKQLLVSHFTPAGPALYSLQPQPDGTLLVSNLLRADLNPPDQQKLIARRPTQARQQKLTEPTDPTRQTTVRDPSARFAFRFPNLAGKIIANTDPQFDGKVVIVAIGGSWCPNCHDEAPFLESLYRQFQARGLEIVSLSFEEADQLKDPARLRAFIARYGITYTVLLAGETEQLNEKIPQAVNLNCWPTSFFLGRDGRVREVHAGFAGPANPAAHQALTHEVTDLIEQLLAEPAPALSAAR